MGYLARIRSLAVPAAFLVLAGVLPAQQSTPSTPQPQSEGYTFTTGTELVLVPVVVRNRDGSHAAGIGQEAFIVFKDGDRQSLAFFEEVREGVARKTAPLRLAPGVFTNIRGKDQPNNLVMVLLDMLNASPEAHA